MGARAGTLEQNSSRNLEAETEAETTEGHCLLALSGRLAEPDNCPGTALTGE